MLGKLRLRPDLLLLLSLLLAIMLNPVLDQGGWRRLALAAITFIPVILSTVTLSQMRMRVWPSTLLALGYLLFRVASLIVPNRLLSGLHWGFLAAFFAFTAVSLFGYLSNSRSVERAHLYTA